MIIFHILIAYAYTYIYIYVYINTHTCMVDSMCGCRKFTCDVASEVSHSLQSFSAGSCTFCWMDRSTTKT